MGFCKSLTLKRSAVPSVRPKDGGRKEEVTSAQTKQRTRTRTKLSLACEMGGDETDLASKFGTEKSASTDFAPVSPEDQDTLLSHVTIEIDIAEDYEALIVDANDRCAIVSTVRADINRSGAWNKQENSERYNDNLSTEAWIKQDPDRLHFIKGGNSSSSSVHVRLVNDNKSEVWNKFDNSEIVVSKSDQSASEARIKQELGASHFVPMDEGTANFVGSCVRAQDFQSLSRCEPGSLMTEPSIKQELLTTEPSTTQEPFLPEHVVTTSEETVLRTDGRDAHSCVSLAAERNTSTFKNSKSVFDPSAVGRVSDESIFGNKPRNNREILCAVKRNENRQKRQRNSWGASEVKNKTKKKTVKSPSSTHTETQTRGTSLSVRKRTHKMIEYRPYPCEKCCDGFVDKDIFLLHMSSKHPEAEVFPCKDCVSVFLAKDRLLHHKSHAHPHNKTFECHICGNGYDSAEELLKHVRNEKIADLYPVSNL